MSHRSRHWALRTAVVAIVLQLVVLYAPSPPGPPAFVHSDKIAHAAVFALPVLFLLLARLPPVPVIAVAAAHAPVSELVQARLLANRAGDPWDAVADLVGVGLGVVAATLAGRHAAGATPDRW